ncbi:AbrB/MazE/SpoVT family DNA-binding domain-containing protein [Methylobacterium trifolii]|uniref:SpoVT-AbrB domain-containing protein n=1 Tax=Methylobacterium trifolii TaxID=1003092 RepID=A0ABQ4U3U9_9HYPH|nr:AbrB/MazE/SpoVT family DNA-binding domain-containing protein [Methylobacterium trifolii]GJE60500.1 hypothetical protein MPOCJGCO_2612 [Methylobacterium trifolii]
MATFEATLSAEGQVTVPVHLRAALNVKPGDTLVFDQDAAGQVRLRPGPASRVVRPSGSDDLALMQAIARHALRTRGADPSCDPIGDYLVADDERTKTRR